MRGNYQYRLPLPAVHSLVIMTIQYALGTLIASMYAEDDEYTKAAVSEHSISWLHHRARGGHLQPDATGYLSGTLISMALLKEAAGSSELYELWIMRSASHTCKCKFCNVKLGLPLLRTSPLVAVAPCVYMFHLKTWILCEERVHATESDGQTLVVRMGEYAGGVSEDVSRAAIPSRRELTADGVKVSCRKWGYGVYRMNRCTRPWFRAGPYNTP